MGMAGLQRTGLQTIVRMRAVAGSSSTGRNARTNVGRRGGTLSVRRRLLLGSHPDESLDEVHVVMLVAQPVKGGPQGRRRMPLLPLTGGTWHRRSRLRSGAAGQPDPLPEHLGSGGVVARAYSRERSHRGAAFCRSGPLARPGRQGAWVPERLVKGWTRGYAAAPAAPLTAAGRKLVPHAITSSVRSQRRNT